MMQGVADLQTLVTSWTDGRPMSRHLRLELDHAHRVRQAKARPLRDGEPVPGCSCPACRPDREALPVEAARRVRLLRIAERLGVGLSLVGEHWRGRCPLCSAGVAFIVSRSQRRWSCSDCGARGDGIDLVEQVLDMGFVESVRWIVDGSTVVPS